MPKKRFRGVPEPPGFSLSSLFDDQLLTEIETAVQSASRSLSSRRSGWQSRMGLNGFISTAGQGAALAH